MDSLTSRFNATLKLKEELEARVKFLASEVERLDPVHINELPLFYSPAITRRILFTIMLYRYMPIYRATPAIIHLN